MRTVDGIKKAQDKKGNKIWICTDGRKWKAPILANGWQKSLNKKAIKVLEGKKAVKTAVKVHGKTGKSYYGKGGHVGLTPETRRELRAFLIKHNIATGVQKCGNVISMNRLLWALSNNRKAVREFAELVAAV